MTKINKKANNMQSAPETDIKSTGVAIPLPKAEMQALRDRLPHGSISVLEERTGFKRDYLYKILRGDGHLNEGSQKIIDCAQNIIKETTKATEELAQKINTGLDA